MNSTKKSLFEIQNLKKGTFVSRPNKFTAEIRYNKVIETAHIHDPGRLTEFQYLQ